MEDSVPTQMGLGKTYEKYAELYDEETAKYLTDVLSSWFKNYRKLTLINKYVGKKETYRDMAAQFAAEQGWENEELGGDTGLIFRLSNGDWNPEEFLVLPPHASAVPSYDGNIITATSV